MIDLLIECKEALINRDAIKCYDSGEYPCKCTLCKINEYLNNDKMKRNLTGIYIKDEKNESTCFEDCNEQTQDKWLDTLDRTEMSNLAKQLAQTIKQIGEQLNLINK